MSRCDIIIPIWNQLDITKKCIDSLEKNTKYPYELLIIDNASEVNTSDYLKSLKTRFGKKLTLIRNKENEGFIKAVNKGINLSKAKYLCILNNDTIVTEGWLGEMVKVIDQDPSIGIINPSSNSLGQKVPKGEGLDEYAKKMKSKTGRSGAIGSALGFCMLIKSELFRKVGRFDEIFGTGNYDDTDFSSRAKREGYRVVRALASYVYHEEQHSFKIVKSYRHDFEKNKKIFESRWGKTKRVIVILRKIDKVSLKHLNEILTRHAKEKSWVTIISPHFKTEEFFEKYPNLTFYHYGKAFYLMAFLKTFFKKKKPDIVYGDNDKLLDLFSLSKIHPDAKMKKINIAVEK